MKPRCPICNKFAGVCECDPDTICQRCMHHKSKCMCEESLRPDREFGLHQDKFEMDEDVADELRRQYGERNEERPSEYWHGYNIVRKIGRKRHVRCPYKGDTERQAFYRGVSDARSRL